MKGWAAVLGWCVTLAACMQSQQQKEAAAESTYLAAQLRCVDQAFTIDEADRCREQVRRAWGVSSTGKDGGK